MVNNLNQKKKYKIECTACKNQVEEGFTIVHFFFEMDGEQRSFDTLSFCDKKCFRKFETQLMDFIVMKQNWEIMKRWVVKKYLENRDNNNDPDLADQCKAALQGKNEKTI